MKKAWRMKALYGYTLVVLYDEEGNELETYKEYERTWGHEIPKHYSFADYCRGYPQATMERLNKVLKERGEYTDFIKQR